MRGSLKIKASPNGGQLEVGRAFRLPQHVFLNWSAGWWILMLCIKNDEYIIVRYSDNRWRLPVSILVVHLQTPMAWYGVATFWKLLNWIFFLLLRLLIFTVHSTTIQSWDYKGELDPPNYCFPEVVEDDWGKEKKLSITLDQKEFHSKLDQVHLACRTQ